MNLQSSMAAAVPFMMLSACGQGHEREEEPQPTKQSAWDCRLSLIAPDNSELRKKVSHADDISIHESVTGSSADWLAAGHLDGRVHFQADNMFPAKVSGDANRPTLDWEIHELRVRATIAWASAQRDDGDMQLDAFVREGEQVWWGDVSSFRMRGKCVRDREAEAAYNVGHHS